MSILRKLTTNVNDTFCQKVLVGFSFYEANKHNPEYQKMLELEQSCIRLKSRIEVLSENISELKKQIDEKPDKATSARRAIADQEANIKKYETILRANWAQYQELATKYYHSTMPLPITYFGR
jgi:predicted  nucleic acid-binding Zn-ribbon protein